MHSLALWVPKPGLQPWPYQCVSLSSSRYTQIQALIFTAGLADPMLVTRWSLLAEGLAMGIFRQGLVDICVSPQGEADTFLQHLSVHLGLSVLVPSHLPLGLSSCLSLLPGPPFYSCILAAVSVSAFLSVSLEWWRLIQVGRSLLPSTVQSFLFLPSPSHVYPLPASQATSIPNRIVPRQKPGGGSEG